MKLLKKTSNNLLETYQRDHNNNINESDPDSILDILCYKLQDVSSLQTALPIEPNDEEEKFDMHVDIEERLWKKGRQILMDNIESKKKSITYIRNAIEDSNKFKSKAELKEYVPFTAMTGISKTSKVNKINIIQKKKHKKILKDNRHSLDFHLF